MMEIRKSTEFPTHKGTDEKIVAVVESKGVVYLATERRMYYLEDGEMKPVLFVYDTNEES
jgi:hypothetical protein